MYTIKSSFALALSAALLLGAGCGGSKPAADVPAASTAPAAKTEPAKPVEAKPADAAPAPAATPAPAPAAAPAAPATPAPAAPAPAAGAQKFAITANDDSSLMWTGYGGIMGHMDGGFANFSGTVTTDPADLTKTQIDLTVDMKTIFSTSGALTKKLRDEHFFNTEKFPSAKFVSTGVAKDGDHYNVSGNLDVLGATRNTTFPATIEVKDGKLHAKAEFKINRNDWGIVYNGTGDSFIEDMVLVKFDIICDAAK